jgi:hypothetical protein
MGGFTDSLFGSEPKTKVVKPEPWKPQQEYLTYGFGEAQDIYNSREGSPFYQGGLYAGLDPMSLAGVSGIGDYATGTGSNVSNSAIAALLGGLGPAGSVGSNASSLFGEFRGDPTAGILASAGAYANNPYVDGMIDAASRDVTRNLYEGDLPALNLGAIGTGNTNSSRTGVAEGILRRGAEDRVGDISAGIRGDAYNKGLDTASGVWSNRANQLLGANDQLGNLFGTGLGAATDIFNLGMGPANAQIGAGQLLQADQQGQYDADFQRWMGEDTRSSQILQDYWNIVGGHEFGGGQPNTYETGGSSGILGPLVGMGATLGGAGAFGANGWLI